MPTARETKRQAALAVLDAMIPPDVRRALAWQRYVEEMRVIPTGRRRG
jgi:hypothetical protein